jgi:hypothetical protein
MSNSILRNNPDDAYIHKMATRMPIGGDYSNASAVKDNAHRQMSTSSIFN